MSGSGIEAVIFDLNGVVFRRRWAVPEPEMLELFKKLKSAGLKLAILSNASPSEALLIRQADWIIIFDYIGMSSETGFYKPQIEAFLDVADNIDVEPAKCLFIDDETYRLTGAHEVGMSTHRFTSQAELELELDMLELVNG